MTDMADVLHADAASAALLIVDGLHRAKRIMQMVLVV